MVVSFAAGSLVLRAGGRTGWTRAGPAPAGLFLWLELIGVNLEAHPVSGRGGGRNASDVRFPPRRQADSEKTIHGVARSLYDQQPQQ